MVGTGYWSLITGHLLGGAGYEVIGRNWLLGRRDGTERSLAVLKNEVRPDGEITVRGQPDRGPAHRRSHDRGSPQLASDGIDPRHRVDHDYQVIGRGNDSGRQHQKTMKRRQRAYALLIRRGFDNETAQDALYHITTIQDL